MALRCTFVPVHYAGTTREGTSLSGFDRTALGRTEVNLLKAAPVSVDKNDMDTDRETYNVGHRIVSGDDEIIAELERALARCATCNSRCYEREDCLMRRFFNTPELDCTNMTR